MVDDGQPRRQRRATSWSAPPARPPAHLDRHREGVDKAEAIEEGIGVAVTGTMKATVDLAEMGYKVATSRPSRFLGRQVVKVGQGIGRRIDAAEERARQKEEAEKKNIKMFAPAGDRESLKQRWKKALVTGVTLVEEIKIQTESDES